MLSGPRTMLFEVTRSGRTPFAAISLIAFAFTGAVKSAR
jgi:hypothetical protein